MNNEPSDQQPNIDPMPPMPPTPPDQPPMPPTPPSSPNLPVSPVPDAPTRPNTSTESPVPPAQFGQMPQQQPPIQPMQPGQPTNYPQMPQPVQPAPDPNKQKTKLIIIVASIAGAVLLIGAIAITLIIVNSSKPTTNNSKNEYETTSSADNQTASSSDSTTFGNYIFKHAPGYKYQMKDSVLMAQNSNYATLTMKATRYDFDLLKDTVESGKLKIYSEDGTVTKTYTKTIDGVEMVVAEISASDGRFAYNLFVKAPTAGYIFQAGALNSSYTLDDTVIEESAKIFANVQPASDGLTYDQPIEDLDVNNIQFKKLEFPQ